MKNEKQWNEAKNIIEVLNTHYCNIESKWAENFFNELITKGYATRQIKAIRPRFNSRLVLYLKFTAIIENGKFYYCTHF